MTMPKANRAGQQATNGRHEAEARPRDPKIEEYDCSKSCEYDEPAIAVSTAHRDDEGSAPTARMSRQS